MTVPCGERFSAPGGAGVGQIHVAGGVKGDAGGGVEWIAAQGVGEVGRYRPSGHAAQALGAAFDDHHASLRFERQAGRIAERRADGGDVVGAVSGIACSRKDGQDSPEIDEIDTVGVEIGKIETAAGVGQDVARRLEFERGGRAALARFGGRDVAPAGDGAYLFVRGDDANAGIAEVGDVEVALAIKRESIWAVQACLRGRAVIALEAGRSIAGQRVDVPFGGHDSDTMVGRIGDVGGAVWGDGDSLCLLQDGAHGLSSVTGETGPGNGGDAVGRLAIGKAPAGD